MGAIDPLIEEVTRLVLLYRSMFGCGKARSSDHFDNQAAITQALIRHSDSVRASSAKQEDKNAELKKDYRRKDTPTPKLMGDHAKAAVKLTSNKTIDEADFESDLTPEPIKNTSEKPVVKQ